MNLAKAFPAERIKIYGQNDIAWAEAGRSYLPFLSDFSRGWFIQKILSDNSGENIQRSVSDLLPNRVGALHGDLMQCIPVNWPSVMQMIKQKTRKSIRRPMD